MSKGMSILLTVLGVILFLMSLLLLIVSPYALIGIAFAVLIIVYAARNMKKLKEEAAAPAPSFRASFDPAASARKPAAAADVDLAGRNISVNKTFSLVIDDVTTTKTETSTRDVFIQDELLPVCRDIMRRRTRIRKDFGVSSPLFFPGDDGSYIKYPAYLKYFRENCTAAVGRPLSPHALRHTHVALLAEHGISLEIISRRLGHSGSQITRDVYFHVTEKLKDLDREALRKISLL